MKKIKRLATLILTAMMITVVPVIAFAEGDTENVDLNGTYHARLGVQGTTSDGVTWMQRIGYYQDPEESVLHTGTEGKDDYVEYDSEFDEVTIAGNGTYTVTMKLNNVPLETITQLQVSTDIPNTGDITFTNLSCTINGLERAMYNDVYVDTDKYADPYACLLIYNNWRSDLKAMGKFDPEGMPASGEVTYALKFTVSGFNYDKVEEETTTAPTEADTTSAQETTAEKEESSASFPIWIYPLIGVAIVVVVVVVIAVSSSKKKKTNN